MIAVARSPQQRPVRSGATRRRSRSNPLSRLPQAFAHAACICSFTACFYTDRIEDPVFNLLPIVVFPPADPAIPEFNGSEARLTIVAKDPDDADIDFVWDDLNGTDFEEPDPPRSNKVNDEVQWRAGVIIHDWTPFRGQEFVTLLSDGHGDQTTVVRWLMEPR